MKEAGLKTALAETKATDAQRLVDNDLGLEPAKGRTDARAYPSRMREG
jgi:hypothetical protein